MANLFTTTMNNIGDWMAAKLAPYITDSLGKGYSVLGSYYKGDHRAQLKVKLGQPDDNITRNFVGLAVDRSVSRLFRGGLEFQLPDGADEQKAYLDAVWDLNKKEIILYQIGLHGAVYGTPYFKISPDALTDPYTEKVMPRLIPIDPEIIRIKVSNQDMDEVEAYIIEYSFVRDGQTVNYREVTRHSNPDDYAMADDNPEHRDTWVVETFEQVGGGAWQLIDKVEWAYNFPPIHHWKNLPSLKSCYGDSDIDDAINVQDKSNFVTSNTGKIIKHYAHPPTIGTGFAVKDIQTLDNSVGTFYAIPSADAKVYNVEMQSDLASSRAFGLDLRQSIFDIAREVDMTSITDKIGALTNFGLRVLYSDAIDKNDTKRQLYGDAIKEINRRLLVLAGYEKEKSNPGTLQWGDALIVNVIEEMTADEKAINLGIVDIETVAKRYQSRYGVDYETIKANIAKQKADKAASDNIGADILRRRFSQGQ